MDWYAYESVFSSFFTDQRKGLLSQTIDNGMLRLYISRTI